MKAHGDNVLSNVTLDIDSMWQPLSPIQYDNLCYMA